MADVNEARLLKAVKGGATHAEAAEQLNLTPGQLSMLKYCQAQVEAGLFGEIPSTAASVKKARNEGNRWELIAARAGISVAKVKDLFGGEDAARASFVGRGRNFSGSKAKSAANKGRKTAAKSGQKRGPGRPPKAKTLADRQRKSGNPS
jgi:hypothetical protein